jgi:hypothetical protein
LVFSDSPPLSAIDSTTMASEHIGVHSKGDSVAEEIESQNKAFTPRPPTFSTKLEERDWLKFRLAQAFRIFGTHSAADVG